MNYGTSLLIGTFVSAICLYKYYFKHCSHKNCNNKCIKDFDFCVFHIKDIQPNELQKITGCKYVEDNKFCNKNIVADSSYCQNHKCHRDECKQYLKKNYNYCHYHMNLHCEDCCSLIASGK